MLVFQRIADGFRENLELPGRSGLPHRGMPVTEGSSLCSVDRSMPSPRSAVRGLRIDPPMTRP